MKIFNQAIVFFFLYYASVHLSFGNALNNHGVYAKIHADVEYAPTNANVTLGNVNGINSVARCSSQCMFNELCVTATYYEDSMICRLFSEHSFQGPKLRKANAKLISFVGQGKKKKDNNVRLSRTMSYIIRNILLESNIVYFLLHVPILSFLVLPNTWYLIKNMTSARDFHKSVFIETTNSVEIVGGFDGTNDLSSTEAFFSSNGSFVRQSNTSAIRRFHTVDRLNDRLVVIAGGWDSPQTAELYDPLLGKSNATIGLSAPRAEHTSAVIDNGNNLLTKVLLVGGLDLNGKLITGDIFDITTGVFTAVDNNMTSARCYHTATTIVSGLVLLAGGINNATMELDSLELYNSSSNLFVPLSARMSIGRSHHTATYIPSMQAVLLIGGLFQSGVLRNYDLFNISTFTFAVLNGSILVPRAYHTATLLLDEQVLIVGGENIPRLSSCELYSPITGSFTTVANMSTARADHTSTLLSNTGQVLVCGGENSQGIVLQSCEIYQP